MVKNVFFIKIILVLFLILSNFNSFAAPKDEIVLEVGEEKFTFEDLQKAFAKNMNRNGRTLSEISRDSLDEFIELFTNYRLKVADAKMRGYEKDSAVLADLQQNRKLLAESYILDRWLTEPYVNKTLERRLTEKKIALIQTVFMEGPLKDTLAAYNKAKEALEKIQSGEDFGKIAESYSEDPRSNKSGGVIDRFITSGLVARSLEDAVYSLKKGDVYPGIIYNRNSYFIIKLVDDAEREFIRGRHILIATNQTRNEEEAKLKADTILNKIKSGEDFAYLAQLYSDDAATAINGGELGEWYSRSTGFSLSPRTLQPEVEKALYNMQLGAVSDLVQSEVGFHILRKDSVKKGNAFDDPNELKIQYKRKYFTEDKMLLMDSLVIAYGYKLIDENLEEMLKYLDTNSTNANTNWDVRIPEDLRKKQLFTYLNKNVSVQDFINSSSKVSNLKGISTNKSGIERAIKKIVEPEVFDQATLDYEKNNKDFSSLMQEFRDGILLFKVEAEEVWNNLKFDTVKAQLFYNKNKDKYKTDIMYDITEIYVYDENLADSLYNLAKNGADFNELASKNTQRAGFREKNGNWGLVSINRNDLATYSFEQNAKKGDILKPHKINSAFSIIKINDFQPIRTKTFEEAIPDFAPEFQDLMQKEITKNWLDNVRQKVNVKIHQDKLNKIIKEKKK